MRPQYIWRARRAVATLGALALGAGIYATLASASAMPPPAHSARSRRREHRVTLSVRAWLLHPDVLIGHDVAFVGVTTPAGGRRRVTLQERRGTRWVAIADATADARGRFLERFWPRQLGRLALRLQVAGVSMRRVKLTGRVATVFHEVLASWYGPGGETACGEALGATTMGVANKTLPCGTMVTLHYRDRTVRVPVIDRGPYVPGRDYDLTYATRVALGAGGVSQIWASA